MTLFSCKPNLTKNQKVPIAGATIEKSIETLGSNVYKIKGSGYNRLYIYILQEYIPQKVKYYNYNPTNPINILAYRIFSIYIKYRICFFYKYNISSQIKCLPKILRIPGPPKCGINPRAIRYGLQGGPRFSRPGSGLSPRQRWRENHGGGRMS